MRYIVGIDLGTTNSSVSYVDTSKANAAIHQYRIPQLVAEGHVDALPKLPSYCYIAAQGEWRDNALDLPWSQRNTYFVGAFALEHGAKVPSRLVSSAKSWLCHQAANRKDKILPFDALDEKERISPVEACRRYLDHIRMAWNHDVAKGDAELELEQQDIILTVPASFDEVARALTAQAAKEAGFLNITFLEEPQAAFYSWIATHHTNWQKKVGAGDLILICDVGGGTTDFSLIEVKDEAGILSFSRSHVGDHLLLGGDNLDITLAYYLRDKIEGESRIVLSTAQWKQLYHEARKAKEFLLSDGKHAADQVNLTIQGSGSSVVQGSLKTTIGRDEIESILVEGFFGIYSWDEAVCLKKSSGMRSMGLPYEDDPSMTKQLANFLKSTMDSHPNGPQYILFNGGTMKAPIFQQRLVSNLKRWFPNNKLEVLESHSLDLAVARGAAYYGRARRGLGTKIKSSSPRTYYLELEVQGSSIPTDKRALCLLPRGSDEGASYESDQQFLLTPNQPVSFSVLTSHVRLHDQSGDLITILPEEMHRLPQIQTILRYGKQTKTPEALQIPVRMGICYTPIGTIDLWLQSLNGSHRWNLEFQLKTAAGNQDDLALIGKRRKDETFEVSHLNEAKKILKEAFKRGANIQPDKIMVKLEESLQQPKKEWSLSVLRSLWEALLESAEGRTFSRQHYSRWWNLAGYLLRPGSGFPLDDFRMQELWKITLADLRTQNSKEAFLQNWICLRRVASGLKKGQQQQIMNQLLPSLFNKKSGKIECNGKMTGYQYAEMIRVIGSLELIDNSQKQAIGTALVAKIVAGKGVPADLWTLGRLGARHLFYGAVPNIIGKEQVAEWIASLLDVIDIYGHEQLKFVLVQLARSSEYKELAVAEEIRRRICESYRNTPHFKSVCDGLSQTRPMNQADEEALIGEELPPGLCLLYRSESEIAS